MQSTRRHSLLAAYPPEVTFEGVEFGPLYVMQVSIQNTSARVQRVRVMPPASEYFHLNYTPKGSVAPGLDITFEVEFQATQERDYHDAVHVTCGEETLEIPIHACIAAPKVEFNGLVNLGTVVRDNSVAKYVTFKNTGHRKSKVTITVEEGIPVTITPTTFTLSAKGSFEDLDGDGRMEENEFVNASEAETSRRVRVEFQSTEIQHFHAIAKVSMTGGQPDRYLDINADVVDQRLELAFPSGGGSANSVPFGSVFFGDKRVIKAFLVNNGPQTSGFNVKFPAFEARLAEGEEIDPKEDPLGLVSGDPEVLVEPMEGMIQPYAKLPVTFTFRPRDPEADSGFKNDAFRKGARKPRAYQIDAAIECPDTGQVLSVAVRGDGIAPEVNVDETHVRFGECAVNDRVDVMVGIQNYGSELPCTFRINKVAHFSARPSSGRLMPGQSLDVVFSFRPAQMGKFANTLQFVIGAGLLTLPVLVEGTSNSILRGTARASATGTAHGALKSGAFSRAKPQFKFKTVKERLDASKSYTQSSKFSRAPAWDPTKTGLDVATFNLNSDPATTYSIDDMVKVSAHKDTYKDFIRTSFKKRTAAREVRMARKYGAGYVLPPTITVEDPGVDLGMAPRSGMASPVMPLPKMNDDLYLKTPLGSSSKGAGGKKGGRRGQREEVHHDPDRLFKKKYKAKPKTQAELRDCVLTLSSADLLGVAAGPKVLDFGRVTVKSTVVKSFSVLNDLPANILMALDFDAAELSRSFPASQVVPGGAAAGFDVVLCCPEVQSFRHTVTYMINGVHQLKFQVVAEVVPITLDLAEEQLTFTFADDTLERSTTRHLIVSNPGNAACDFRWASRRGSSFEVFPTRGTIEAGGKTEVSVTFSPSASQPTTEDLRLQIEGGKPKVLKCVGEVVPAKCTFKSKKLEFGTVSVGQRTAERTVLKNVSPHPAVFYASVGSVAGGSVVPAKGLLMPGKTVEFTVTLAPKEPHVYDSTANFLLVDIRGNKPVQLPIEGEAVIPRIAVVQDQFDFGQVAIGASAKLDLELANDGDIPANLIIDLTAHPDFQITRIIGGGAADGRPQTAQSILVPIHDDGDDDDEDNEDNNDRGGGAARGRGGPRSASRTSQQARAESPPESDVAAPHRVARYKATVLGGSPLQLQFVFKPTGTACEHAFELPIALENVDDTPSLRRAVLAEAMTPRIRLSSTHVDFGEVIISRDQVKRVPHHMTLIVANESSEALEWEVDTAALMAEDGGEGVFELEPAGGRLEPETSTKVKVSFTPEGPDSHNVVLPVYLDGNRDRPYLELEMGGCGVHPRLLFDADEVVLPPVPLGQVAKGLFYVNNQGYEDLDLRFRLPADRTRMPITLEFPEGKSVSLAKSRLPVVVSFSSPRPLAFTSRVDFLDADENRYSVKVTGITDNSVFTVHSFLTNYAHEGKYSVAKRGGPVSFEQAAIGGDADAAASPSAASPASAGSGKSQPPRTKTAQRRARLGKRADKLSAKKKKAERGPAAVSWQTSDGDTVFATLPAVEAWTPDLRAYFVRWLNQNLLPADAQVTNFPADLAARSDVIIEMLEGFLRKPLRGKITRVPKSKTELITVTLRQWKAVLNTLITGGALLHHVHPEALLPKDLYLRHFLVTGPGAVLPGDRTSPAALQRSRMLEQRFKSVAPPAWANLLFQIVKLFVVGRVGIKQYLSVPLVQPLEEKLQSQAQQQRQHQPEGPAGGRATGRGGATGGSSRRGGGKGNAHGGAKHGSPLEARLSSLAELSGSNVQSVSENLMLRWLNVLHEASQLDELPRRAASLRDLADGVLLCSALVAYVPSLGSQNQPLHEIKCGKVSDGGSDSDEATVAPVLTDEEADFNVANFVAGLEQLDFPFVPDAAVVRSGNELQMVLLLTTVFNLLPQFSPKATIEFAGDLGQEVRKALALRNPTRHALTYSRVLTGDPTFKAAGAAINVAPGATESLDLSFTSRFTRQARARLELKSHKQDGLHRSILVFDLVSRVLSRKPQQTVAAQAPLYAPQTIDVEVKNPFDHDCTFRVTVEQPEAAEFLVPLGSGRQAPPPMAVRFPDSFALRGRRAKPGQDFLTVAVPANGTATIAVFFVAFEMRRHAAELIFVDDKVGEFMYDIVMDVESPDSEEQINRTTPLRPSLQEELKVRPRGRLFGDARAALLDALEIDQLAAAAKEAAARFEALDAVPRFFRVETSSPFYEGAPEQMVAAPKTSAAPVSSPDAADSASAPGTEVYRLGLQPKDAGKYPCNVVFRSPVETRVYTLLLDLTSSGPDKVLEFVAPARQAITQDIPIVNNTDKPWAMRAVLKGAASFSGPPTLKVEPHSTGHYKLVFKPTWLGHDEASLVLSSSEAKCSFSYQLLGKGEEPLALDHVSLECAARDRISHTFELPRNTGNRPVTYQVESDLPQISGDSEVVVEANAGGAYTLGFTPQVGGTYSGAVTFRDALSGQYFWFTVDIHASSPQPEDDLEVVSETQKAVSVEISLGNPLNEAVTFDVALRGDGLIGDTTFTLAAGDVNATYELIYSPLVAGVFSGSITFTNDQLGEFWYKLALVAKQAPPTKLPAMACGVGTSCAQQIRLDNPTDSSMTLVSHTSNMTNYRVEPARVTIPAYASAEVTLRYIPSSIDRAEDCVVTFSNRRVGKLVYHATGSGQVPSEAAPLVVYSALHQGKSESFNFRNPFDQVLPVKMSLVADPETADGGEFRLIVRQEEVELGPFAQLHIPFLFIPRIIGECRATLIVEGPSPDPSLGVLQWRYPIVGITEVTVTDNLLSFECRAREVVSQPLALELPGYSSIPGLDAGGFSEFDFDLVFTEGTNNQGRVNKALTLELTRASLPNPDPEDDQSTKPKSASLSLPSPSDASSLEFSVLFQPLVMFTETVELVVRRKAGGVWRFQLKLDVTEPVVDDTVTIEAKLKHTSSVSFELHNVEPETAQFKAFFSADSPLEFNVFPALGELAPYGSAEGTTFIVSFTPQDYGKAATGKLFIQTEEMMWSYEVRGTHPAYAKPSLANSKSKIDTGLSRAQLRAMQGGRTRPRAPE